MSTTVDNVLEVKNLCIAVKDKQIINDISFSLKKGEILGIVGETGSGKSVTAMSVLGFLPKDVTEASGSILFDGKEIMSMSEEELTKIRGKDITAVFQDPLTYLDPVMKVGKQVGEPLRNHGEKDKALIKEKVLKSFTNVALRDPERVYKSYPHELSGGMRQRVLIAMAMIGDPKLLIADEPTTALDAKVAEGILELLKDIHRREPERSMLFISHDLNVIRSICDNVMVMYGGKILEEGTVDQVFNHPQNDYTKKLVSNIPDRDSLHDDRDCVLEVKDLNVYYKKKRQRVQILKNINLSVSKGETVGLVGESGCGKSTLAKAIVGLNKEYEGTINTFGKGPQMVFQDAYSSLNPAKTIGWILEEPLKIKGIKDKEQRLAMVKDTLYKVGLNDSYLKKKPRQLSGGERQRICIGVALSLDASLIVADEAVSSLDVTVSSKILSLIKDLQKEKGFGLLFISHDKELVSKYCHRVIGIKDGEVEFDTYNK